MRSKQPLRKLLSGALLVTLLGASLQEPPLGIPFPTASPKPGSLPEIYHTKTSEKCDALRGVTLPVGFVTRRNDQAFRDMALSLVKFLHGIYPADVPSVADVEAAMQQPQGANNTGITDAMGDEAEDDQLLYGPGQILKAAAVDHVAQQIFANLVVEQQFIDKATKENPDPKDPNVIQMRQRAQNLIDLQRALADAYEEFAGTYLGNQGMASQLVQSNRAAFKLELRRLLLGESGTLAGAGSDPFQTPPPSASDVARYGNASDVVNELKKQEAEFAPETLNALNECNGTNFVLKSPSPSPTP